MNYFETNYVVNKLISPVFDYVLDLMRIQNDIGLFGNAKVTTDNLAPNEIGKSYYITIKQADISIKTTITLQKIETPNRFMFGYSYETISPDGAVKKGCSYMPWETMTCLVTFKEMNNNTKVTTSMYANGVKTLWGKLATKVIALTNYLEQRKYNKRTVTYINENIA